MKTLARERDKAEVVRRLSQLRSDSARRWGRMSPHQMVCHLADSLSMALGEKRVEDASGVIRRTILKWIVLYVPVRWPPGIRTSPEIDQQLGGTRPADFSADLAQLVALLERFDAGARAHGRMHPIFGRMTKRAWLRWGYLHIDHHLRQFGL